MADSRGKTVLIFSQVFVPDPASVGQHMADVALELARRGHRVRVYTSARGYENPSVRYPRREMMNGVDVRRLGLASFGKKSIFTRAVGTASFLVQCTLIALFTPRVAGIFFSTSPPLIGFGPGIAKMIRRVPIAYWAMDLNPDQLIAMGKVKKTSLVARILEATNRFILKKSDLIVALDRFMAERLRARGNFGDRMKVMPPWPHEDHLEAPPRERNPFVEKHGLASQFVVMYSGNHSPANPLGTLLQAVVRLKEKPNLRFLFVGGGNGKKEVENCIRENNLTNATSLPYQPFSELGNSLGAADVHVVSLGTEMVGVVHPCKIYGAMAVGRPILFLGPRPSHVSDILEKHHIGWHVAHGDVGGMVKALTEACQTPREQLELMGKTAAEVLGREMAQKKLCGEFCDWLESALKLPVHAGQAGGTSGPRQPVLR